MNISFIGYGNMAQAMLKGLGMHKEYQYSVAAPSLQPKTENGLIMHNNNIEIIHEADVVILAVKPANVEKVLLEIGKILPQHSILISVVAGIPVSKIMNYCNPNQGIIRCMPNLPICVGQGATPLYANSQINSSQKKLIERIFKPASILTWLDEETDLNPLTALSGSGPAYVYLFIESMIEGAKQLGLSEEIAEIFTLQTLNGALALLNESKQSAQELRKQVTSPAGTTAAAINSLEQGGFAALITQAMRAAFERAKQLS